MIEQYTKEMIKAIQTNKILRDSGWWNDTAFVEDISDDSFFDNYIIMTVTSY